MDEELVRNFAVAAIKKVFGATTNITYYNYIRECKPFNEYVKWHDYEGNVFLHAYKCKMRGLGGIYECFTVIYIEGLDEGEGLTLCYYLPSGPWGRVKRLALGECPKNAALLSGAPRRG